MFFRIFCTISLALFLISSLMASDQCTNTNIKTSDCATKKHRELLQINYCTHFKISNRCTHQILDIAAMAGLVGGIMLSELSKYLEQEYSEPYEGTIKKFGSTELARDGAGQEIDRGKHIISAIMAEHTSKLYNLIAVVYGITNEVNAHYILNEEAECLPVTPAEKPKFTLGNDEDDLEQYKQLFKDSYRLDEKECEQLEYHGIQEQSVNARNISTALAKFYAKTINTYKERADTIEDRIKFKDPKKFTKKLKYNQLLKIIKVSNPTFVKKDRARICLHRSKDKKTNKPNVIVKKDCKTSDTEHPQLQVPNTFLMPSYEDSVKDMKEDDIRLGIKKSVNAINKMMTGDFSLDNFLFAEDYICGHLVSAPFCVR